jgi:hypothetical protein
VRKLPIALSGLLVAAVTVAPIRADIGLGTQFTDAVLENLESGGVYNLRELRGIPYSVRNVGNAEVDVEIEVVLPKKDHLKENYEPIPDPGWIRLHPSKHRLPAGGMGFSDIVVSVPDDPQWNGRHFQADLWAHTVGTGVLATGVRSRLRFSVGPGPESLAAEKRRKAMVSLNFDIWPSAVYVMAAAAGKTYDVAREEGKAMTVTNRSNKSLELVLKTAKWNEAQDALPEGYEAADPAWLSFRPERVKIKPFRVQEVKFALNIPREHQGKKLAFVVQACLPVGTVVNASNRVFVTVKDEERRTP